MTAGLNTRASIWRMDDAADDAVGGAVYTGTVAYSNVLCRFQAQPIEQVLLQQGLETNRTFTAVIVPGTLVIYERDEFELTYPYDDPYVNKRFRIEAVRWSDHNPRDPRRYIMLDLSRSVQAHKEQ